MNWQGSHLYAQSRWTLFQRFCKSRYNLAKPGDHDPNTKAGESNRRDTKSISNLPPSVMTTCALMPATYNDRIAQDVHSGQGPPLFRQTLLRGPRVAAAFSTRSAN